MKAYRIILLCAFCCAIQVHSQLFAKSLFIEIDRETDSLYENENTIVKIQFGQSNEAQNRYLNMQHFYIPT